MQTNAILRKRSFRLFWRNRGMLWAIFLLFALINFSWGMIQNYLLKNALLSNSLFLVYQVGLAPIMNFGLTHILLRIVHGSEVNMTMLLDFVKPPQVLKRVYTASLIVNFPYLIILLTNILGTPSVETREQFYLLLAAVFVAVSIIFWIMLRLFLLPYLFITKPNENISALVKLSYQRMKGKVKHLIWFGITVYFWLILLLIGLSVMLSKLISYEAGKAGGQHPLVILIFFMTFALLNPYISLSLASYANELLPEEDMKKARRKSRDFIG